MYLMAAPEARGLFAKAIAQSAYMVSTPELRTTPFGDVAGGAGRACRWPEGSARPISPGCAPWMPTP